MRYLPIGFSRLAQIGQAALLVIALLFFTSCTKAPSRVLITGKTMGTQYHITLASLPDKLNVATIKSEIKDLLKKINQQMSTYIADSEISRFNQYSKTDWFPVSEDLTFVVSAAQHVSQQTQGAFDITVAPLVDLWGFGTKTIFKIPNDTQINTILNNVGYQQLNVSINPPALQKKNKHLRIDLSAIAKGFAVDKVAELLEIKGIKNYLVEIGGEIHIHGMSKPNTPWQVGIESPNSNGSKTKQGLLLSNIALATSGNYRNYFIKDGTRYSHTINPLTGRPITHNLASITVLHQSSMMADAYATALTVMGDDKGKIFAKKLPLYVNMMIKQGDNVSNWQNIDPIKTPKTAEKCKKQGGCVYLNQ